MPVFDLKLNAELENVASIAATDDTIWRIKVRCTNCSEVSPSFIEVSSAEEMEVPGTRGTCNCLYSCKLYVFFRYISRSYSADVRERSKSTLSRNP